MDPADFPRFVYLVLLLVAVGGYVLVESRRNLGKTLHQAAIWAVIFLGAVAIAGLWPAIQRAAGAADPVVTSDGIEVPVGPDGHFYVTALVNGAKVRFVIDTGASTIVLTERDAERAGFDPAALSFVGMASTANGAVATAPVRIDSFSLGDVTDRNIAASVNGGELDTSLLGMSYLSEYQMTVSRETLVLRR
jgi:aspartyl protease family protein